MSEPCPFCGCPGERFDGHACEDYTGCTRMVAALYVETNGVYWDIEGVDPWDEERDARLYAGPWPVVAHPPCARWSRLAGFTEARFGLMRGDDGGCFEAALASVRKFGGVLEHPAYSAAWAKFGLARPSYHGWTSSILDDGWTAYVEQGRYGLPVKKATWLYAVGVELPKLRWGYTPDANGDTPNGEWGGMDSWRDRFGGRREQWSASTHRGGHKGLTATTPDDFRDVLLGMARSINVARDGAGLAAGTARPAGVAASGESSPLHRLDAHE